MSPRLELGDISVEIDWSEMSDDCTGFGREVCEPHLPKTVEVSPVQLAYLVSQCQREQA